MLNVSQEKTHPAISSGHKIIRIGPNDAIDVAASLAALIGQYPEVEHVPKTESLLMAAVGAADSTDVILATTKERPQADWLFDLAGRLKAILLDGDNAAAVAEMGVALAPFAVVYADRLILSKKVTGIKDRIDWFDADAVLIEFEEVWRKRLFPKGSQLLENAAEYSTANPLELTGNRHFVRVLNVAYFLQRSQPNQPILLPISAKLADLIGVTPATLGTVVAKAIREGYLKVEDEKYSIQGGKARKLRVDMRRIEQARQSQERRISG